jgi:flagellar L-ring protein FlgH
VSARAAAAAAPAWLLAGAVAGCAAPPPSIVEAPLQHRTAAPPVPVERAVTGAIYSSRIPTAALFSSDPQPQKVGDLLKVQIDESQQAGNEASSSARRESEFASKGPGSQLANGLFGSLLNQDARAAGSNSVKGEGRTERSRHFSGQLTVSVINVLPNGFLVVAGERKLSVTGEASALRFSGIVNPQDIRQGNVVASNDTLNARIEFVGQGELTEAASRSWLQRVFNRALAVW